MEMEQPYYGATLTKRLSADVIASGVSALLVSPALALMDRAIVEQAATHQPLLQGLKKRALSSMRHPAGFLSSPSLRIIFTLYGTTYLFANGAETLATEFASGRIVSPIVFVSTFGVNVPLGVWKDTRYSQLFGAGTGAPSAAKKQMSKAATRTSVAAFLARDAITIFASFSLPGAVSEMIPHRFLPDAASRAMFSQLMVPVMSQIAATPAHLVALDYCTRTDGASPVRRVSRVKGCIPSTTVARCARIVPAFGIGIVANRGLREELRCSLGVS